ncbi:MAG: hypothetical protein WKG07_33535 [Hymenobacter sp.]
MGFIGDVAAAVIRARPFILRFAPGLNFLTRRVEFTSRRRGAAPDTIRNAGDWHHAMMQFALLLKVPVEPPPQHPGFYMIGRPQAQLCRDATPAYDRPSTKST